MPTAVIILNVLLAVAVIAGIVGTLVRAIATQGRDHAATPVVRAPVTSPICSWLPRLSSDGSFDLSSGTGGMFVHLIRSFWRADS
jgi:hypothetical protein